jgi:opine dehydrogenase
MVERCEGTGNQSIRQKPSAVFNGIIFKEIEETRQAEIVEKILDNNKISIIGTGNAGPAFAFDAKLKGRTVALYDIADTQLKPIIDNNNRIKMVDNKDESKGEVTVDVVTRDLIEATKSAKLLICVTPAHTHKDVAKSLAPVLVDGQIVLLSPGAIGGVIEFRKVLKENGCTANVLLVESESIPYACRRSEYIVRLGGMKKELPCAGLSTKEIDLPTERMGEFFSLVQDVYPAFKPCEKGVWATSLNNMNMLFHPLPTLLNLARMETSKEPFLHYQEACSASICPLLEMMDKERLSLASAMGITGLPTAAEWLQRNYGASGSNLYEAFQSTEAYNTIKNQPLKNANDKLRLRYVVEDVPCALVPVSCLAKKFGVETPLIDLTIQLANLIYKTNFIDSGRNLKQLGLEDLSTSEIISMSKSSTT